MGKDRRALRAAAARLHQLLADPGDSSLPARMNGYVVTLMAQEKHRLAGAAAGRLARRTPTTAVL